MAVAERSRGRTVAIVMVLLGMLILISVGVVANWPSRSDTSPDDDQQLEAPLRGISLARPEPRPAGFVGSQACRECHEEIYEQYAASAMGRSMSSIGDVRPPEELEMGTPRDAETEISDSTEAGAVAEDSVETIVNPPGPRQYHVLEQDGTMVHRETMVDGDGEAIYAQDKQIDYVVGSGRRGRAYLLQQGEQLYQSPIGWFAEGGWDLSPGYDPQNHPRFSRRIGDGCLYCHAGRANSVDVAGESYGDPVFHEVAIGCERCHGPGEQHIAKHTTAGPAADLGDPIVNPSKLEPLQRDAVCNQCHLMGDSVNVRYGRGFFDFRPGDRIEDVFVILEAVSRSAGPRSVKAVSQVEQMQSSKCYQASNGALGCTSCHDPHWTPPESERVEFYRQKCFQCHEQDGCAEPLEIRQREPANNSCIHCHMPTLPAEKVPHTSLTHHGIPRFADQLTLAASPETTNATQGSASRLRVFGDGEQRLPRAEVDRALGRTLMSFAWQQRSRDLATEALMRLLNVLEYVDHPIEEQLQVVDDVFLLNELGSGYFLTDRTDLARLAWRRALEIEPGNETALLGLAKLAQQARALEDLDVYLRQLLELNPNMEDAWSLKMQRGVMTGDAAEAIEAGEKLLELNPMLTEFRVLLATAYRRAGDVEQAAHHEEIIERIKTAQQADTASATPSDDSPDPDSTANPTTDNERGND